MASDEFKDMNVSYSYRIAKASQNMMSVCLSNELNKFGICVLSIHPGQVLTDCGSNDASESPKNAATRIKDWIYSLKPKDTGSFIYPGVAGLGW